MEFMRTPFQFLLGNDQLTLDGIQQFHINVGNEEKKLDVMHELFPILQKVRGITFCNARGRADWLKRMMTARGHTIERMVWQVFFIIINCETTSMLFRLGAWSRGNEKGIWRTFDQAVFRL